MTFSANLVIFVLWRYDIIKSHLKPLMSVLFVDAHWGLLGISQFLF